MSSLLVGSTSKNRTIHGCKWDSLCKRKFEGGLGFRELETFNKALLDKQCWKILKHPDSLAARVLQGCYFHNGSLLDASKKSSASFVWNSLLWGRELITQHFSINDCRAVLRIPIGSTRREDSVMWHYDNSGGYTVKSGYRVVRGLLNTSGCSNSSLLSSWWNCLWGLGIPLKIKVFVWKACHDWLPTMANLACRKSRLMKLKSACSSWLPSTAMIRGSYSNLFDFVLDCFSSITCDELRLICTILWRVWFIRNSVVHGAASQTLLEVSHWARRFLAKMYGCKQLKLKVAPIRDVKWRPPDTGCYKINCDVVVDVEEGFIGIGVAVRDSTGFVMASSSQRITTTYSSQVAETVAITRGLQFAKDSGLLPCVLESDAAVVVKWINDESHLDSECGGLILDILELISCMNGVLVNFVLRLANQVAHGLAQNGLVCAEDAFWMEEFPGYVRGVVIADMPA
ncbi:hypothetical protein Dsin_027457 [Dipteronia sinensis]|uniref:RNase H type-1 domain-containing protein n=1 Tax=Dipteronia sinensis TaxID=43782 RepID=A0AAD9ZQD9_9ROSI|nr:hypothetical protein Dsin_027457 [Dipteronia sinensis]